MAVSNASQNPLMVHEINIMEQATVNTIVQSVEFSSLDLGLLFATIIMLGAAIFGSLALMVQRNQRFSSEFRSAKG